MGEEQRAQNYAKFRRRDGKTTMHVHKSVLDAFGMDRGGYDGAGFDFYWEGFGQSLSVAMDRGYSITIGPVSRSSDGNSASCTVTITK